MRNRDFPIVYIKYYSYLCIVIKKQSINLKNKDLVMKKTILVTLVFMVLASVCHSSMMFTLGGIYMIYRLIVVHKALK